MHRHLLQANIFFGFLHTIVSFQALSFFLYTYFPIFLIGFIGVESYYRFADSKMQT